MKRHTTGPWKLRPYKDLGLPADPEVYADLRGNGAGRNFLVLGPIGWEVEGIEIPNVADARLIEAAPDLLEALERMTEEVSATAVPTLGALWKAMDAIRKARGEP